MELSDFEKGTLLYKDLENYAKQYNRKVGCTYCEQGPIPRPPLYCISGLGMRLNIHVHRRECGVASGDE